MKKEKMIRDRLLYINEQTWNSDKLDLQEKLIKELMIDYSNWLLKYKRLNPISNAYTDKELLKIYLNENRR